ncbi:MAG: alpha-L-fucosidase [Bacteroidia bacterium]|nr:alpha-L-fucosidase [Bacteroidia bacterium]
MKHLITLLLASLFLLPSCRESRPKSNYIAIKPGEKSESIIEKASRVVPSERQVAWQELEFTMFAHFGMNTFTNREWGQGTEDPALFNPTAFDAGQWVQVAKDAGMKMIIVTAKHHDGFCLWQTDFTKHCVKSSPWMGGKGDVVGALAKACQAAGMKFGVYLSPWDRHEQTYGTDQYNDHFVNQLTELLTKYGRVDEVWFDGACGEGPNGKRQVYDWLRFYSTIRKLQPQATIAVMGPDVRWVGTESGYGRPTEWSVVPYQSSNTDKIAAVSQKAPTDGVFIPSGDMMQQDLGSRSKIIQAPALIWYPSEVDVSIRPGWFYHASEDERVKTPEKLLDIWFASVGQNSLLLLNVPPDQRGLIHENDAAILKEFKSVRDVIFNENLADGAKVSASSSAPGTNPVNVLTRGLEKFWMPKKGEQTSFLTFELTGEKTFDCLEVCENIRYGQRIEQFSLEIWKEERWREVTRATTAGYSRFLRFEPVTASKVRVRVIQSRSTPAIAFIALHKRLPQFNMKPESGAFIDSISVRLSSDADTDQIYYSSDGSIPDVNSLKYRIPLTIKQSTLIKAVAIDGRGVKSFIRTGNFVKANFSIRFSNPPSTKYPPKNQIILLDGRTGDPDFANGEWLGWEGKDMIADIDLGEMKEFKRISADFLNSTGSWIFLPTEVIFEYSSDGRNFETAGRIVNDKAWDKFTDIRKEFGISKAFKTRYIRVKAVSPKICPPSHGGAGNPCWIFADEITLNMM